MLLTNSVLQGGDPQPEQHTNRLLTNSSFQGGAPKMDPESFLTGQILLFDKPYGWTSFFLVKRVRSLIERKTGLQKLKVGHAGTLDPLATGLVIIATGRATKRIDELQSGEKEYLATIRLGATTPCFDLEKPVDAVYPYEHITIDRIQDTLVAMTGEIDQVPPLFSAKKVEGKRAYELARKGGDHRLEPRRIMIRELQLLEYDAPDLQIRISCSKGTYIRALARDIGEALGSGAHLAALRRTRSGDYSVEQALIYENFEKIFD